MCGICGEYNFSGRSKTGLEKITGMARLLEHRGPDQQGFYLSADSQTRLGHRRLNIIDLSTGNQPMKNEDDTVVIVFNGEIYNFLELRAELESKGHLFKTRCDTEVIIHLYEQEGVEGFRRMVGMYAFAIYDEKHRRLVLARDPIGIKPLFYCADSERLVFASELQSLVFGLGRIPSLRDEAIFDYLMLQYVPGPNTIFSGVKKLEPGAWLIADPDGVRTGQFMDWKPAVTSDQINREQAADEIAVMLEECVRSQLIADVPLGAFLSGGIDSSTIVAFMKRIKGEGIQTFSVDFSALGGASEVNETFWSNFASEFFKTEHHQLRISAQDALGCFDQVVAHLDEPVADPACIPTYLISKLARSKVTVVLSGEGADELFGGYLRYRLERIAHALGILASPALARLAGSLAENFAGSFRSRKALRALEEKDPVARHILWASVFPPEQAQDLLMPRGQFFEPLSKKFKDFFKGPDHLNNLLWADFRTWLADDLLVKVDRMSMAVSLEARVPYLDHRLAQKVFALPGAWKIGFGSGKKIFRKAVSGIIPGSIINRKKAGFTLPLGNWFRNELKGLLQERLNESELQRCGIFEPKPVAQILETHLSGREDLGLQLYSILLLQLWKARIKNWGVDEI